MKPPPFAYVRANTLDEALTLVAEAGDDAKFLAGGQSLMPLLVYRLSRPTHLVDIGHLPGLGDICPAGGGLLVGGLVRHAQVERSVGLVGPWRAIREAACLIGHYPIRTRGTFGGSVAHADPASELPVVSLALNASFVLRSAESTRTVPAAEFFMGPFMTVLEPTEAVVEIRFPAPPPALRSAFEEFTLRSGDFALASAAVAIGVGEDGVARDVRIALGSVGPAPLRAREAESALEGAVLTEESIADAAQLAARGCDPSGGPGIDAEFRRDLVTALVTRALRRLKEES